MMKITKGALAKILKEEILKVVKEADDAELDAYQNLEEDEDPVEEGVLDMLRDKFGVGAAEDEDSDEDLAAHDFLRSIKVDPKTKAAADSAHADPAYAARFANRANRGLEES
jgi:hypothetical protein